MVATLEGHARSVTDCAWSPDGTVIATSSSDIPMQLWDASTFQILHALREDSVDVRSVSDTRIIFSPDGHWLVTSTHSDSTGESCCFIWDIPKDALHRVVQREQGLGSRAFYFSAPLFGSRNALLIATGLPGGYFDVRIWDIDRDEILFRCPSPCLYAVKSASFSRDGRLLLMESELSGDVKVWDLESGVELLELKGRGGMLSMFNTGDVRKARFSPCGRYVASAEHDYRVLLWRISDGACTAEFSEHRGRLSGWVKHLAFSPDWKTLSSADAGGTVVIRQMLDVIPLVEQDS